MRALPERGSAAKKGDAGRVLVIGGSAEVHGAPLLTALGALAAGVDLVRLFVPACHVVVARQKHTNFLVSGFSGDRFAAADVRRVLELADGWADTVVIGCGFFREEAGAVTAFLQEQKGPTVVDAGALQPEILPAVRGNGSILLTPHSGEFERVFQAKAEPESIRAAAREYGITILKKGPVDLVTTDSLFLENRSGCPEMSVGGTGDTLAGICAGLMAQGFSAAEAAETGSFFWGKAGEQAVRKKRAASAEDMIERFAKRDL